MSLKFSTIFANTITICFIAVFLCINANIMFAGCEYKAGLNGTLIEEGNQLTWTTSMEFNNKQFIIEKSSNGINFKQVGILEGAGDLNEDKTYTFLDESEKGKITSRSFYRLVQVDFDENISFTHTVIMTRSDYPLNFNLTSLSSSITDRYFNLNLESTINEKMKYSVQTDMGEKLKEGQADLLAGTNSISVDLEGLTVGKYQFTISVKGHHDIIRIEKVDSAALPKVNLATKGNDD